MSKIKEEYLLVESKFVSSLRYTRDSQKLQVFYKKLRQRGKAGKVALVAVMRKLLLQLNAVARRGTPWENRVNRA